MAVLLTITTTTTTAGPATDLGYLLQKNPARLQSVALSFGTGHVFYPEASEERCTAALLVEVDPVGLVCNVRGPAGHNFSLARYVNDRPYGRRRSCRWPWPSCSARPCRVAARHAWGAGGPRVEPCAVSRRPPVPEYIAGGIRRLCTPDTVGVRTHENGWRK